MSGEEDTRNVPYPSWHAAREMCRSWDQPCDHASVGPKLHGVCIHCWYDRLEVTVSLLKEAISVDMSSSEVAALKQKNEATERRIHRQGALLREAVFLLQRVAAADSTPFERADQQRAAKEIVDATIGERSPTDKKKPR